MSSILGGYGIGTKDPAPLSGTISAWGWFMSVLPAWFGTSCPGRPTALMFPASAGLAAPAPPPVIATMWHRDGYNRNNVNIVAVTGAASAPPGLADAGSMSAAGRPGHEIPSRMGKRT